jgi:hypothetical protein
MIKTYNDNYLVEKTTTIPNVPIAFEHATKKYFEDHNPFNNFYANCVEIQPGHNLLCSLAYDVFKKLYPECKMSPTIFNRFMAQRGIEIKKKNDGRHFLGIKFTDEYNPFTVSVSI